MMNIPRTAHQITSLLKSGYYPKVLSAGKSKLSNRNGFSVLNVQKHS